MGKKFRRITFVLDPDKDQDILDYWRSIPALEKSEKARQALRVQMGTQPEETEPSRKDIYNLVQGIRDMIQNGQLIVSEPDGSDGTEPEEARRNLDNFLLALDNGDF